MSIYYKNISYSSFENQQIANFLNHHIFITLILVVYFITYLIVWFNLFKKADKPGWIAFVPFYNIYTMGKVTNRINLSYMIIMINLAIVFFSLPYFLDVLLFIGYIVLFINLLNSFAKRLNTKLTIILLCQYLPFIGIFFLDNIKPNHNK